MDGIARDVGGWIEVAADEIGEAAVAIEVDDEAADRRDVRVSVGGGPGQDCCDRLEELLGDGDFKVHVG